MDLQLIPTPSLDFQVALNLGETPPLTTHGFIRLKQPTESNITSVYTENNDSMKQYILKDSEQFKNCKY